MICMLPSRLFFDDSFFKGDESIKSDIYEKDGRLVVEMEAPGYTKDDIDISIDKGTLSISFDDLCVSVFQPVRLVKKIRNIFIVKEKVIVKYLEVSI